MRRIAISAVLLLGACRNEPTFDERFAAADKAIASEAAAIDAALATQSAGAVPSVTIAPPPATR